MRFLPVAVLLLSAMTARAGTVEVLVRERDGGAVPNQAVVLLRVQPEQDAEATSLLFAARVARGTTDAHGRVVFEGIAAGSYTAAPDSILSSALFFADAANPLRSVGAATLVESGDRGSLEIVLDRGTWVSFTTLFEGDPFPRGMAVTMQTPGAPPTRLQLDDRGLGTTQLSAGSWTFVLEHPAGLTLARAEVDASGVDPMHVTAEIEAPSSQRQVVFTLVAPCKVLGSVTSTTSERPSVHVEATRTRPGSLPGADLVSAILDKHNAYVLFLPDGTWSIHPAGETLVDSVPAETTVTLAPGQEGRADFVVREKDPGDETRLMVVVLDPERRPVANALVEAWPSADLHPTGAPAASERTPSYGGSAALTGLAAGSYRIVAGARGIGTGSTVVGDYEAKPGSARRVEVTLRRGATVRAHAAGEAAKPVPGIVLRLAATQLPEVDGFSSEGSLVCTSCRAHALPTDPQGNVVIAGIAPGRWTATAEAPDGTSIVEVSKPDFSLDPEETVEIELKVRRAASVTATLRCDDRGPLPPRVDTRLLLAPGDPKERTLDLGGERRDRLALGPLEAGDYRLAVRPEGFDGWTFVPGVESAEDASPVHVEQAETVDAGTLVLRCLPQAEVALSVRSKQPVPDLRRAEVRATWTPGVDGHGDPLPMTSETDEQRIVVRPLPAGAGTLDVTIRHPYFLPPGEVRVSLPLTLARGKIVPLPVAVAAIGGEIVARGGVAARLGKTIVPAANGVVSFGALAPGTYRVDVCADATCDRVSKSFDAVAVVAGTTTEVAASR